MTFFSAWLLCLVPAFSSPPPEGVRVEPAVATEPAPAVENNAARDYFGDVKLADQHGNEHRLYSDLLADHTVVITSFFADCEASCEVMNRNLQALQADLGDRLGADVRMLSITLDPVADTSSRLAEFASSLNARPGWYFLTGPPAQVKQALAKLGLYVEDKHSRRSLILIGNVPTGLWKKALDTGDAAALQNTVRTVMDDTGPDGVPSD